METIFKDNDKLFKEFEQAGERLIESTKKLQESRMQLEQQMKGFDKIEDRFKELTK